MFCLFYFVFVFFYTYFGVYFQLIIIIDGGNYRSNVANLKRRFVAAGGGERAAELVELYAAVGYDNLIPAYAKYNWSWIQYYNIDVYMIIAVLVLVFSSFIIGCFLCTFRKLCHTVSKKKAD